MSANGTGPVVDDNEAGSWASETLPLALRRELLDRELKKLSRRREDAARAATATDGAVGQQEASRPQADGGPAQHAG
jgi:hypothetical protein